MQHDEMGEGGEQGFHGRLPVGSADFDQIDEQVVGDAGTSVPAECAISAGSAR